MKKNVTIFSTFLLVLSAILFLANANAEFIDFRDRWAILIGVGKYSNADIPPLSSPQNDVNSMKKVLIERGGFLENHITTLIDEQVTYKGIRDAFKELSDREVIQQDDFVLFYFSGRGARITDDLYPDLEEDGLDECLLPYDAKRETKENFLRDDELGQLLNTLNAKGMTIIIDSCYSAINEKEKGIPAVDKGNDRQRDGITTSDYLPPDTTIILEACAPNEITLDGETISPFTQKLIESLNNDDVDSNSDSVVAFDELHIHLKKKLEQQTPSLIGKIAAETLIIPAYVPITSEPSDAKIFIDGKDKKITTPNNIILLDRQEHQIQLKKAGYHDWPEEPMVLKASKLGKQEEIKAQLPNAIVVKGRLVDKSKKPIEGVQLTLKLKTNNLAIGEITTDANGDFSFNDWQKNPSVVGDYEIVFRFKGNEGFREINIEEPNDDVDIGTIELEITKFHIVMWQFSRVAGRITQFLKAAKSNKMLWWLPIIAVILIVFQIIYVPQMRAMKTEKYRSENYPTWERQIENSLLTEGKASLVLIDEEHQAYASSRYIDLHSDFNLFYDEKKNSLRANNPLPIEEFNNCWENAVSNLDSNLAEQIKSLQKSSTNIIRLLCDAMGFTVDENSKRQYERLWTCMVNAPILRTQIPSRFPLICSQQKEIANADIRSFRNILDIFEVTGRFALIIIFENIERACQIFQKSAFRSGFDFVFLGKDDALNILITKEPRKALMRSILKQIDLTAVSPYITAGPAPENMFFGRDGEIKQILQGLNSNSIAIVGGRRIGKTSILQRLHRDFMNPDNKWYSFYANLQIVDNYKDFFEQIRTDWKFEATGSDYSPKQFYDLVSNIAGKQKEQTIVFLIDEIDNLLWYDVNNHNENLFETFRSLSHNEKCRFIFSGERVLNKQTHDSHSPLFNFCINISLSYLDVKSAERLITEPMTTMDVEIEDQQNVVEEIIDISACHPRIIQYICNGMISLISTEQTRCITIEHFHRITNTSEFKRELIETIRGRCEPLEQIITLLMIDNDSDFTESEIRIALNKAGIIIPDENLLDAINNLQINSVFQPSEGRKLTFKAKTFPAIVKEEMNLEAYVEQLKGEIQ